MFLFILDHKFHFVYIVEISVRNSEWHLFMEMYISYISFNTLMPNLVVRLPLKTGQSVIWRVFTLLSIFVINSTKSVQPI